MLTYNISGTDMMMLMTMMVLSHLTMGFQNCDKFIPLLNRLHLNINFIVEVEANDCIPLLGLLIF